MSVAPPSGDRGEDLGGVRGAARGQGEERNTRDPSAQPGSGKASSYKPRVKSTTAQRESEGIVVPASRATNNAAGGKGPCGDHVGGGRTREGMTGTTGPITPVASASIDKVRQLQRRLWVAAKRSPERRFHALLDRIWRRDVLQEAWRRVKRTAAQRASIARRSTRVEQYGVERLLEELHVALRAGTYRPQPVLRRYIPKADGRQRPLGIPTVRDRVAQMAATIVLEPIFEADFRRLLVWLPAEAQCDAGPGDAARAGRARRQPRARRGHPRLLRQHRSRRSCSSWSRCGSRIGGC